MTDTPYRVVLGLDGTLGASVHHHVLAWPDAFRAHDVALPAIHAAIGMGSDRTAGRRGARRPVTPR